MTKLGKLVRVTAAKALQGFKVELTFEDGSQKVLDLDQLLRGPIFEPLRVDRAMFEDIRIEGGTIAWSNGADIDPDVLYYELDPAWTVETERE